VTRARETTHSLRARKQSGPKLVFVTAYDATMARLLDAAGVDVLMVGDSLGMVVQGHADTLPVTLEDMVYHCRAVVRAQPRAHVVCDLPFLSYQVSPEQALASAGQLVKLGGAESVKLEGGARLAPTVERLVAAGIPVMGHIGLTPQSVHQLGGFRVQGRTRSAAEALLDDARTLEQAGVFALVVEGVPAEVGRAVTAAVSVPTIGIGAGPDTDGQVLVCYDLLGMYRGVSPRFVKHFAELGDAVEQATRRFVDEVRQGTFPGPEHVFSMAAGELPPGASSGGGSPS
jgi:3-methyl-2-oxobutanoate hydroxymethyltransferase